MSKWDFFNTKTGHFYFGLTSQKQGGDLSLDEAYSFDKHLQVLHPDNKHLRLQIRPTSKQSGSPEVRKAKARNRKEGGIKAFCPQLVEELNGKGRDRSL